MNRSEQTCEIIDFKTFEMLQNVHLNFNSQKKKKKVERDMEDNSDCKHAVSHKKCVLLLLNLKMDETPVWADMVSNTTIDKCGKIRLKSFKSCVLTLSTLMIPKIIYFIALKVINRARRGKKC